MILRGVISAAVLRPRRAILYVLARQSEGEALSEFVIDRSIQLILSRPESPR